MKTFNEFYAQWEEIQRIYHEASREAACDMMEHLQIEFQDCESGYWSMFNELAETMDCGNRFPVIRDAFLKVESYNRFFSDLGVNEFAYCEESTATLQNIAEFMDLGWKVDMHAVEIHAYKWENKMRKAIKFTR